MTNIEILTLVAQYLAAGRVITKLPAGKAVTTDAFVARHQPTLDQRLRLYGVR